MILVEGNVIFHGSDRGKDKSIYLDDFTMRSEEGKDWKVKLKRAGSDIVLQSAEIPYKEAQIGQPLLVLRDALNAMFPVSGS